MNTGNPLEFEAWNANEPNNYGSAEDCATMRCPEWYGGGCFWNDVPCSLKYRPICGKELLWGRGLHINRLIGLSRSFLIIGFGLGHLILRPKYLA